MNTHGYTTTDIIAASVVVLAGIFIAAVLLVNPARILSDERNEVRLNDVHDIAEALIELRATERERFDDLLEDGRWAVGLSEDCQQHCAGDGCVDLSSLTPYYITEIPFDHHGGFSKKETGYSVDVNNDGFVVMSCVDDMIRVTVQTL